MNVHGAAVKKDRRTRALTLLGAFYFFLAAGIVAIGYAVYVVADAHRYQASGKSRFELVSQVEAPTPLIEGGVIGEIEVPRLGMQVLVVQGDSPKLLRRAAGHMPETPLPWEAGNVVLAGHRDSFFRPLRDIRSGDAITFKTNRGDFQYQVESTELVSPSDMHVLDASSGHALTLITCFPFYYMGSAPKRFVVHAREVGSPERLDEDSIAASYSQH
jgi:sortase A